MQDIIFISLESWDEVWRRNQFLCSKIAKRFPEFKILFVGPARDISNALRTRRFDVFRGKTTWIVPGFPNITVTKPLKLFPNSVGWGRSINEIIARKHILKVAEKVGIKNPTLWINPHSAVHMVGKMKERMVVYDITDDWTQSGVSEKERRLIKDQDRSLCKLADLVIVCSKELRERRKLFCRKIFLLPNGVDVKHYSCVSKLSSNSRKPRWALPIFGYTGSLHTDRLDIDIIIALARAFPRGSVVLVGPDFLHRRERKLLNAEKNIYFPGVIPYAQIADYIADFDVCIAPHVETKFTESLNPLKLWEYLACGKPIVSTNIAGFRDYSHLCRIASGPEKFIFACKDALNEEGKLEAARIAEAAKNSWDSRIDRLMEILQDSKDN